MVQEPGDGGPAAARSRCELRGHADLARTEDDLDRAVAVGSQDPCPVGLEPPDRGRARVAVGIARADRDDRDRWPDGVEERVRGRGPAAVVGDLEDLDAGESTGDEDRVDVLLDVAGEQEPASVDFTEQDDRDIVDRRAGVGRLVRDRAPVRPEDAEADLVEGEPVAGRKLVDAPPACPQLRPEGGVPRPGPAHPRLEQAADAIALEQERQAGDVVLMGVAEDDEVEPPIPGRQAGIEGDDQATGVWSAVDEQAAAAPALDEDRVALADVEDRQVSAVVGPVGRRKRQAEERRGKGDRGEAGGRPALGAARAAGSTRGSWVAAGPAPGQPSTGRDERREQRPCRSRRERRQRRLERERGERERGRGLDDPHDRGEQDPGRQAEQAR